MKATNTMKKLSPFAYYFCEVVEFVNGWGSWIWEFYIDKKYSFEEAKKAFEECLEDNINNLWDISYVPKFVPKEAITSVYVRYGFFEGDDYFYKGCWHECNNKKGAKEVWKYS